jgi:hypothetical protein
MCWGFDINDSIDGPNGSSDIYGFPPAQLFLLRKMIDGFGLRTSLPRTLDGYVDKANAALGNSDIAGACKAVKSLRSTAVDAGGRLTNDQRAQIVNAADGIRASLGCS